MEKIFKWIIHIILILIMGMAFYKIVGPMIGPAMGDFDLSKFGIGPFGYHETDYGWLKTSLPFTLKEAKESPLAQDLMNAVYGKKVITQFEIYSNQNEPSAKKFRVDITYMVTIPGVKHQTLSALASALAGEGFGRQAKQAVKQAQRTDENGTVKYAYQAETKRKHVPTVLVAISCTKKNQDLVLLGYGENTPQNKKTIQHILDKTECFPEKK